MSLLHYIKNKWRRSYQLTIFVGLKVRVPDGSGETLKHRLIESYCQDYCTDVGLCVTVTKTKYVYKGGKESGVIIGLMNYPRFPTSRRKLRKHAYELALKCLNGARQCRVSIVGPHMTRMLSDTERIRQKLK